MILWCGNFTPLESSDKGDDALSALERRMRAERRASVAIG